MALEILGEALKLTILAGLAIAGTLVILIWKKNLATRVSYLRILTATVSTVAIFYIFTYPLWLLLMLTIILVLTIFIGRFFCGWVCPFGLYMDLFTTIRKTAKTRHRNLPERLNKALHRLRYLLLVFFLILPFLLTYIDPALYSQALYFVGPFKPLKVLLAPLIPLIVPWKGQLVVNDINLSYPYLQEVMEYSGEAFATYIGLAFVVLTFLGSFFFRRVWCRFCPTGSSLAIVNHLRGFRMTPALYIKKDEEKCTKCGICRRVCPVQVSEIYEQKGGKIATSMCILCTRCVEMCPEQGCLKVTIAGRTIFKSRNWLEPSKSE
jgi:polyferredoxin